MRAVCVLLLFVLAFVLPHARAFPNQDYESLEDINDYFKRFSEMFPDGYDPKVYGELTDEQLSKIFGKNVTLLSTGPPPGGRAIEHEAEHQDH